MIILVRSLYLVGRHYRQLLDPEIQQMVMLNIKKNLILTFFLIIYTSLYGQINDFNAVLLSRESDYQYRYKPRTREEILINFQDSIVYYRKNSHKKFKPSKLPVNNFFKDSINYQELHDLIIGKSNETDANCEFRNKGSIKITIIYGDSNHNHSESYEFGSVIACIDEDQFLILKKIQEEFFLMEKLIFN